MDESSKTTPHNVEQARSRIDGGSTGEKVDWPDPAAAPLGADAEAGGNPPTKKQLKMDNDNASSTVATPRRFASGAVIAYAAIACILLAGFATIILNS